MSVIPDSHVAHSVEASIGALEQLAASLRAGGFAEGAASYQRMAEVLVAQRMFHEPEAAAALDPLAARFDHLGSLARDVFELLEPYTSAMRRLASIAPERLDPRAVAAVHDQLRRRGRRGATASVLARAAHVGRDLTDQVLDAMVAEGSVVRRAVGDTVSYRLVAP